jgi:uncharacterized RDD family membrane protein YckC
LKLQILADQTPYPENMTRIGIWVRLWAFVADLIVLEAFDSGVRFLFGLEHWPEAYRPWPMLLFFAYSVAFESSPWQATPGKIFFQFHVATLRGNPMPWWRSTARNLLRIISILPFLAGYLTIWFTPRRQALHDLLAGGIHVFGSPQIRASETYNPVA